MLLKGVDLSQFQGFVLFKNRALRDIFLCETTFIQADNVFTRVNFMVSRKKIADLKQKAEKKEKNKVY